MLEKLATNQKFQNTENDWLVDENVKIFENYFC